MSTRRRLLPAASLLVFVASGGANAQSDYYNLDAGRPTRVEDAVPTARHELELQLASFRLERVGDGSFRWRLEPKLSYGVLPFTELELRAPVMRIIPRAPAPTSTGFASLGVGALHAFNLETAALPAIAVAGEVVLPVGSLAAPRTSYAVKALLTKTFPAVRVQLNGGAGTWSVRLPGGPRVPPPTCGTGQPGVPPCEYPPIPPDLPCDVAPAANASGLDATFTSLAARCMASGSRSAGSAQVVLPARTTGSRWMVGLGVDRAIPLASTLLLADVIVEQFEGLYDRPDWTAEAGVRRQITPQLVIDVGVGRRFAGVTRATSVSLGFGFGLPAPTLRSRSQDSNR